MTCVSWQLLYWETFIAKCLNACSSILICNFKITGFPPGGKIASFKVQKDGEKIKELVLAVLETDKNARGA